MMVKAWLVALAVVSTLASPLSSWAANRVGVARTVLLEGQVEALLEAGINWQAVQINQEFIRKDNLKTREASYTDLEVFLKDYLRINENTQVGILELLEEGAPPRNPFLSATKGGYFGRLKFRLRLLGGNIFTSVRKQGKQDQFVIYTPTAYVGIRGSANSISIDPRSGVVEVVQATGSSLVWAPGRWQYVVEVGPGMTTTVAPGGNPETPSAAVSARHQAILNAVLAFNALYAPPVQPDTTAPDEEYEPENEGKEEEGGHDEHEWLTPAP